MIDTALLILRLGIGLFFATSGYRKLFNPATSEKVNHVFDKYHVAKWQRPLILWGQLLGGLGLITGTLTHLAAAGLVVIMVGAVKLSVVDRIEAQRPVGWTDWVSTSLCTAESMITLGLIALAFAGAGSFSMDGLINAWIL